MTAKNRCTTCGACCACFTVVVGADEIKSPKGEYRLPPDLVVPLIKNRYAMQGTEGKIKRCAGLNGLVGQTVCCTIYDSRPASCREFRAAWEAGAVNAKCDLARAAYGLFAFSVF